MTRRRTKAIPNHSAGNGPAMPQPCHGPACEPFDLPGPLDLPPFDHEAFAAEMERSRREFGEWMASQVAAMADSPPLDAEARRRHRQPPTGPWRPPPGCCLNAAAVIVAAKMFRRLTILRCAIGADRAGVALFVRATDKNVDLLDRALRRLGIEPVQPEAHERQKL